MQNLCEMRATHSQQHEYSVFGTEGSSVLTGRIIGVQVTDLSVAKRLWEEWYQHLHHGCLHGPNCIR
jgi:hypothetical protein